MEFTIVSDQTFNKFLRWIFIGSRLYLVPDDRRLYATDKILTVTLSSLVFNKKLKSLLSNLPGHIGSLFFVTNTCMYLFYVSKILYEMSEASDLQRSESEKIWMLITDHL